MEVFHVVTCKFLISLILFDHRFDDALINLHSQSGRFSQCKEIHHGYQLENAVPFLVYGGKVDRDDAGSRVGATVTSRERNCNVVQVSNNSTCIYFTSYLQEYNNSGLIHNRCK